VTGKMLKIKLLIVNRSEAPVMKQRLLTTIAAVVLVGCGPSASDISIHTAAFGGHIKAIKQHLAAGADVDAKSGIGLTPLHEAADRLSKEIAELLIAKGADVNAKNDDGETPLHYAAFVGQKEIPKEIAELLIAKGADVNAKDVDDVTPLDVAINDDVAEIEIADLLRKHGGKTGEELKAEEK